MQYYNVSFVPSTTKRICSSKTYDVGNCPTGCGSSTTKSELTCHDSGTMGALMLHENMTIHVYCSNPDKLDYFYYSGKVVTALHILICYQCVCYYVLIVKKIDQRSTMIKHLNAF